MKKVKEEQEQKRDRELYEKQVQNKQRLFRLEFEARQGIILEDDEKIEKEELTVLAFPNASLTPHYDSIAEIAS